MLTGTCPGCEAIYYGWALAKAEEQICDCGDRLVIEATPGPDLYKRVYEKEEEDVGK